MHELVVLSGKGGTGKTSVVASLAILTEGAVLADCDVEAADLDLILGGTIQRREAFRSGHLAVIAGNRCVGCGECIEYCRFGAIHPNGAALYRIDPLSCEGCGTCARFCPGEAIGLVDRHAGEWLVSQTRRGPLVHARLRVAQGNSGKLVAAVRAEARRIAAEQGKSLVIIDGAPGIGCPVIASLTGSSLVLVVTEPTPSGEHDLERVLGLTRHFGIPATVAVNKWDLNPSVTDRIEQRTTDLGATVAGRIRYDETVTQAQLRTQAVVESEGGAARDIRTLWLKLRAVGAEHGITLRAEDSRSEEADS